jgi:hypothetical protein
MTRDGEGLVLPLGEPAQRRNRFLAGVAKHAQGHLQSIAGLDSARTNHA